METFLDTFAIILWILAALAPIVAFVFLWRKKQIKWYYRILLGLLIGGGIGVLLFWLGLSLIFRNGIEIL